MAVRAYLKAMMICSIIIISMNLYFPPSTSPVYLMNIELRAFEVKNIIAQFTQTLVRDNISPTYSQVPIPYAGRA
jgi:hypothetical protein